MEVYRKVIELKRNFKKEIAEINPNIEILEDIKRGSDKVLCKCLIDGYEWRTRPYDLLRGFGCHACKGVPRYTTETFVRKMREVNPKVEVLGGYKRAHSKIKWKCKNCSNTYETKPNGLLNGHGCKECNMKEFHLKQRKNTEWFKNKVSIVVGKEYIVLGNYKTTETKIKMMHQKCNFEFLMRPHNFLQGQRCPKCNGGVRRKTTKYFQNEVKSITNNEYEFIGEYKGNNEDSHFMHIECGQTFITSPVSFLSQGTRCPYCFFISKGELEVKIILEKYNVSFIQQKTFDDLKAERKLRFDFYLPDFNLCIEYDGKQHFEVKEHWGGIEEFKRIQMRDSLKNDYCRNNNINLLRIHYKTKDIEGLIKENLNV